MSAVRGLLPPADSREEIDRRWARGVETLAGKLLTTVYRRVILVARSTREPTPAIAPVARARFAILAPGEVADYRSLRPDHHVGEIGARLARGDRCLVARIDGRIVHAGWLAVARGPAPYLHGTLTLDPGDLYGYDSFTAPAWRGCGFAPTRHLHLLALAHREGRGRVASIVAVENRAGRRVFAKLGYHEIASYHLLRFGPWAVRWTTSRDAASGPVPALVDERRPARAIRYDDGGRRAGVAR